MTRDPVDPGSSGAPRDPDDDPQTGSQASRYAAQHGVALSLVVVAAASLVAVSLSVDAALIRDSFGLTEVGVGAIASCIYIGAAASSVIGGQLTDAWGPAPVLVLVTVLLALGEGLAALAPSVWIFFGGVLIAGFGYGAVNSPTNALANPRSARRRGLAISIKQSGIPLGGAFAGLLVPPLAVAYGWRLSLALPIALCLVLAAIFARLRPTALQVDLGEHAAGHAVRLRLPRAYTFGFLMGGVQVTIFTFLALYLVDARGMSAQAAGSHLALLLAGGLVGRIAWGWLSDRQHNDRIRVLQTISLLAGVALLFLSFAGSSALLAVLVIIGVSSVGWNGVYIATVSEAASPQVMGLVTGRSMRLVNLGAVLVPPVFGLVVRMSHGWVLAWSMCAALSLLSLLLLQASRATPVRLVDRGVL